MKILTVGDLKRFLEEHRNSLPDDALIGLSPTDREIQTISSFEVRKVRRAEPTKNAPWPRYFTDHSQAKIPALIFD
jgi:hypothetical protein